MCFNNIHYFNNVRQLWVKGGQEHLCFCSLGMGQKLKTCRVGLMWVPWEFSLGCSPSSLTLSPFSSPLPSPPFSLSSPLLFQIKLALISMVQVQVEMNEGQLYTLWFCWEKTWTLYTIRNSRQASYHKECTIDWYILHSGIYYCVF